MKPTRTIPAMPVRETTAAVGFHLDRPDLGTREFAALDADGNLVTFFEWRSQ